MCNRAHVRREMTSQPTFLPRPQAPGTGRSHWLALLLDELWSVTRSGRLRKCGQEPVEESLLVLSVCRWCRAFTMYFRLNNFTGRLIGSTHIQPYFPIVRAKLLYFVHMCWMLVRLRPETTGKSILEERQIIIVLLCKRLLNMIK